MARALLLALGIALLLLGVAPLLPLLSGLSTTRLAFGGTLASTWWIGLALLAFVRAAGATEDAVSRAAWRTAAAGLAVLFLSLACADLRLKWKAPLRVHMPLLFFAAVAAVAPVRRLPAFWRSASARAAGALERRVGTPRSRRAALASVAAVSACVFVAVPLEMLARTDWSVLHLFGKLTAEYPRRLRQGINAAGYRDRERSLARPPETRMRILTLGDSITFGQGVADDEVFGQVLARLLGPGTETVNLSCSGWSTADELRVFRREGAAYGPDWLILGLCPNDVEPASGFLDGLQRRWRVFERLPFDLVILRLLDARLNIVLERVGWREGYARWEDGLFDPAGPHWEAWRGTVREFAAEVRKHNLRALAVTLPYQPVPGGHDAAERKHAAMIREFADAGWETLDLWPEFRRRWGEAPPRSLYCLPNDSHPGAELHRFFAKAIAEKIRVPEAPPGK